MFLSFVYSIQNYSSFDANSSRDSISIKKYEFRSGLNIMFGLIESKLFA